MNLESRQTEIRLSQFYYICKNKQLNIEEWLSHNLSLLNSSVSIDSPTFPGYTALHFAVICRNLWAVKILLELGADFTIKNQRGKTALHLAMSMILLDKAPKRKPNLIPIIDQILFAHQKNYVNVIDNMGLSHFHIACFRNNYSIVLGFLEHGADFNGFISHSSPYWPGYTPLHIACRYSVLSATNLLLKFGADIKIKNSVGLTPLHIAVKKCDGLLVESLFLAFGQDSVNPIDDEGISLLHAYCIANYKSHSLENFLRQISDINITIKPESVLWAGYTPLHVAVHCKCTYPIMLLLQHGADINAKNVDNISPFQLAICKKLITNNFIYYVHKKIKEILESDEYLRCLFEFYCACMTSNLDSVKQILENGLCINAAMPPVYCINLSGYTALHFSVELGDRKMIEFLLENGADLCAQDINGLTPLHLAMYKKNYSIVTMMFSYYTKETVNLIDDRGLSHLHIACLDNTTCIIKLILKHNNNTGAMVNMTTSFGETPLHFAVKFNNIDAVKLFLDEGADFTLQEIKTGSTPLHFALKNKNKEIMSTILSVHDRKIVNPIDNMGLSHFHIFCMKNETHLIEQFLEHKIAIDAPVTSDSPSFPGFTPLHFAVKYGCTETIRLLLNNNFDITTKDTANKVPLNYIDKLHPTDSKQILDLFWLLLKNNNTKLAQETGLTGLHVASMRDDSLALENLLHRGLHVDARTSEQCPGFAGFSPLHFAVKFSNIQIAKVLLRNRANVHVVDKYGFTPLHLACSHSNMKVIECLLANNANPAAKSKRGLTPLRLAIQAKNDQATQMILSHPRSKLENPMDNKGLTYLHIACLRDQTETVRSYVESGAKLDEPIHYLAPKYSGCSPLHIAVYRRNRPMIDLILGHWAKVNLTNRDGCTALHLTCTPRAAHADIAAKLLRYGADPNARNTLGDSLVDLAIKYHKMEILEVALRNKLVRVQFRTVEGSTLIHRTIQLVQAKENDYAQIFKRLLEHGCDLNLTDGSGRTALHQSYWPVNLSALKALLRCGANIDVEDRSGRTIVSYFFEISTSRMPRLELYEIFRKHLAVRRLAGFPLGRTNDLLYERLREENDNYSNEDEEERESNNLANLCEIEFQRMKDTYFGRYVSLYGMFRNVNRMAIHLSRNDSLVNFVKSHRFDELFPECGCLVMMQYGKALARKGLLEPALEAIGKLISDKFVELRWNMECSEAVIDYLNNADLCSLAAAVRKHKYR